MAPKANYRAKLAELRAARESGKKTFDNYKVQDADSLYEEVDEDGYKKIVRDRLDQDDFVVDDNGEGYADDGREEWDRMPVYDDDSDSEEAGDVPPRGRQSKACEFGRISERVWFWGLGSRHPWTLGRKNVDADGPQPRSSARTSKQRGRQTTRTSASSSTKPQHSRHPRPRSQRPRLTMIS
jgi:hypothetical protein